MCWKCSAIQCIDDMECWPAIPPITNHCRPLHAAAGVIYLLLHCTELHFALPWLRLSYINPATHLYVRAKHRCVCIPCPCLFHLLHMPPQSSSNVIPHANPCQSSPHLGLRIPTSQCAPMPLCRITSARLHSTRQLSLLPLTVPACCPFPQRLQ